MFASPGVIVGLRACGDELSTCITLVAPISFDVQTTMMEKPLHVTIPAGYVSDGASVPRFFWRLLSPPIDPITIAPSIAHDWLYDNATRLGLDRADCDSWYCDALRRNGYPLWKCLLTYIGIRLFGRLHTGRLNNDCG